ncbi:hypothetical protein AWB70_05035 [Caballeronia cordobensis]|uniref:Uncharacterized protein n=1 Tax=Caballeronia cordobensis TaxID=1353886 RepID=A0A158IL56_CABCO|nr:hypothetical protein [Caballeronia cordobensis]SAL57372.1 hypothetical protein AWB70_05035 [Caballeronia cordobensis]
MALTSKSSSNTSTIIEIDLDRSDDNNQVETNQLIQLDRYDALKSEIDRDLKRILRQDWLDGYPAGSGLVYFIDGTRGAGKSTFLKSAFKGLSKDLREEGLKIAPLAHIDPSRVESNEVVLLHVLKALKREVDKTARSNFTLNEDRHLASFRDFFRKLAGGLSLLAPGHNPLQDVDAELFLDWGLERAGHSEDLRSDLHNVIDSACSLLNVNALILAFDDADTYTEHARSVLECIRKYLDMPKLIILVTGDLELYSLQVRDMFSGMLHRNSKKDDLDEQRVSQRIRMLDHLEDQYLLKLFPIRRRIQLRPLWNLIGDSETRKKSTVRYKLVSNSWLEERDVDSVIAETVQQSLRIRSSRDIALYREFLLKQPLRSVLQLLSKVAGHLSQRDNGRRPATEWSTELSDAVCEALRSVALGSLYKFGVDVDAIAARELPALIEAVFDLAVREGDVDTAAYLRPQPSDPGLRNSFASLSADVAAFCAGSPSSVIQYMLAGPGSVALYGQTMSARNRTRLGESDRLKLFKKYVGIGRKEDSLNWARHAAVILSSPFLVNFDAPTVRFGVIGLCKREPTFRATERGRTFETVSHQLEALREQKKPQPVFALSLIDVSGIAKLTLASIFNILGIIERLLSLRESDLNLKSVLGILSKPYPALSISRPEWEEEYPLRAVDEVSEKDYHSHRSEESGPDVPTGYSALSELSRNTLNWLRDIQDLKGSISPSSVFIGKIWTRLYFSLEKVSIDRRGKVGAASLMELFALCVVNAFLVEELEHHLHTNMASYEKLRSIDRTNPLTSPDTFVTKLKHQAVNRTQTPLTALIVTCPLILGLLNAERRYADGIAKLARTEMQMTHHNLRKTIMGMHEEEERRSTHTRIHEMLCDSETWDLVEHISIP